MKKIIISSVFVSMFVFGSVQGPQTVHGDLFESIISMFKSVITTTYVCYNTCSPVYTSYEGTVILDLRCNASSPAIYTGTLWINGKSTSYQKNCPVPPPPPPASMAGSCGTLSGQTFPSSQTSWPAGTFCTIGTVSPNPTYPSAGFSVTWSCSGVHGGAPSSPCSTTVLSSPPPPLAPTLDFTADPLTVSPNGPVTLRWEPTNAVGCESTGGWSGPRAHSGVHTLTMHPPVTTTYNLRCWNGATPPVSTPIISQTVTVGLDVVISAKETDGSVVNENDAVTVGETVKFNARVTGGTPPYTNWKWSNAVTGDGTPYGSDNEQNYITKMFGVLFPSITVTVKVEDSTGVPVSDSFNLKVEDLREPQ